MKNAYKMPLLTAHEMRGIQSIYFDSDPRGLALVGCTVTRSTGRGESETVRGVAVWNPGHVGHPSPDTIELDNGRTLYMR